MLTINHERVDICDRFNLLTENQRYEQTTEVNE